MRGNGRANGRGFAPLQAALMAGAALAAFAPGAAFGQSLSRADMEAKIKALEEAVQALKAELEADRAAEKAGDDRLVLLEKSAAEGAAQTAARVEALEKREEKDGFKVGDARVKFGGYVKAEALVSDFSDGDVASGPARDFYVPGAIPVAAAASDEDARFDAHVKQTRLSMTVSREVGGHKLGAYVETDFQSAPGTQGSEVVTNAYDLALRRAYVTVDGWLFGQDWTTFQNVAALPETTDFIGPTEGTAFGRQVMVRHTRKLSDKTSLVLALENPETFVAGLGGLDDDVVPDAVARINYAGGFGDLTITGLARRLSAEIPLPAATAVSEEALGWGVSASGKIKLGKKNDARFMVTGGEGIGRYVGLGFAPDAVLVNTAARQELEPVPLVAGFAALRVFLAENTRANVSYSFQTVDNDSAITAATANKEAWSAAVNVFTTPIKGIDLGLEYRHAERELENGTDGALDRVHLIAKQSF